MLKNLPDKKARPCFGFWNNLFQFPKHTTAPILASSGFPSSILTTVMEPPSQLDPCPDQPAVDLPHPPFWRVLLGAAAGNSAGVTTSRLEFAIGAIHRSTKPKVNASPYRPDQWSVLPVKSLLSNVICRAGWALSPSVPSTPIGCAGQCASGARLPAFHPGPAALRASDPGLRRPSASLVGTPSPTLLCQSASLPGKEGTLGLSSRLKRG